MSNWLKGIKGKKFEVLMNWVNNWCDFHLHSETLDSKYTIGKDNKPNHITEFGRGYNQAVSDFYEFLTENKKYLDIRKRED